MSRILLLGGTGDALLAAGTLGTDDVYSLAGVGARPLHLPCKVRVGGFGGAVGLEAYVRAEGVTLIVDATHPYAATISGNARQVGRSTGVPYWQLQRARWTAGPGDDWRLQDDWAGIMAALLGFRRVLFTSGRAPLTRLDEIPPGQHWFIRCLGDAAQAGALTQQATFLPARGPFTIEGERRLFDSLRIDALVSKNSGGGATQAKLEVAREKGVPVIMLARPPAECDHTAPDTRLFTAVEHLMAALKHQPGGAP